jgi:hypothetical protein
VARSRVWSPPGRHTRREGVAVDVDVVGDLGVAAQVVGGDPVLGGRSAPFKKKTLNNTKVGRLVLKAGKIPTTTPLCVVPGGAKPQKSCA